MANVQEIASRVRSLFVEAEKAGVSLGSALRHLDADGSGSVEVSEFVEALKAMPQLRGMREGDIDVLVTMLDEDGSGTISLEELMAFVHQAAPSSSSSSSTTLAKPSPLSQSPATPSQHPNNTNSGPKALVSPSPTPLPTTTGAAGSGGGSAGDSGGFCSYWRGAAGLDSRFCAHGRSAHGCIGLDWRFVGG